MKRGTAVAWVAIKLTQGKVALIDAEDLERVTQHTWSAAWIHYDWRAVAWIDGKTITLHRFVMNAQPGQEVDHKNGDGLDCRKSELRIATHRQNNQNAYRVKPGCFKGVRPSGRKWRAKIKAGGKDLHLGTFTTAEEAARAYDAAAVEHFGEFACLNFRSGGAPAQGRTGNLQLRRLTLYPIELRAPEDQGYTGNSPNAETPELENVSAPADRRSGS